MPRPFTVVPHVMASIRPMRPDDVRRVAFLHSEAMGDSLWAQLGERFLRNLYRALLKTPQFVAFVYEDANQIEGFIAGSTETNSMMRQALFSNLPRLTLSGILGLKSWSVAQKLLETSSYFRNSSEELQVDIPAESLFCSFTVATRGKRISGHINKVLFDTLAAMGHPAIKITTETNNEGANRQLLSWGFESQGHFVFYGKEMLCYTLQFSNSDRVSPRDWRFNPWTKEGE